MRLPMSPQSFLAGLLALAALAPPAPAHAVITIDDLRSPGVRGDALLSLDEAIRIATDRLQLWELSPAEAAHVVLDPGRFQVDTLIFDPAVFPGTIVLDAPLPSLDDPIGDYIDGTNFNQLPIGSVVLDGSRLAAGTPVFTIEGASTGIYGWRIVNAPGDAIAIRPSTFFPQMRGILVQANIIEGAQGAGVALRTGSVRGVSWGLQCLENLIKGCRGGGVLIDAEDGALQDMSLEIERNILESNGHRAGSPALHGIAILGTRSGDVSIDCRLAHNQLTGNAGFGILLDGRGPQTVLSGVLEKNTTAANALGLGLIGASIPGSSGNDLSASLRGHVSSWDRLAAVLALGGAVDGADDAHLGLSVNDLYCWRGGDLAQVLIGAGAGSGHTVSAQLKNAVLDHSARDGLRMRASEIAGRGNALNLRAASLQVLVSGEQALRLEGGAGRESTLALSWASGLIAGAANGILVSPSDAAAAGGSQNALAIDLRAVHLRDQSGQGLRAESRSGASADLELRGCVLDGNRGNGIELLDPLGLGGLSIDLGTAAAPGRNAFLDNLPAALVLGSGRLSATAVGNYWGRPAGPAAAGAPNGVAGSVDTSAPLGADPSLRLESAPLHLAPGGSVQLHLEGTPGSAAVIFVGRAWLDLSSAGGPVILDPWDPATAQVAAGFLPLSTSIPVPADPQLAGLELFLQAFGAGDPRLSGIRSLRLR